MEVETRKYVPMLFGWKIFKRERNKEDNRISIKNRQENKKIESRDSLYRWQIYLILCPKLTDPSTLHP
jgi:hypothetical protein